MNTASQNDQIAQLLSDAQTHIKENRLSVAAEALQRALVLDPVNVPALSALAEIALRLKNWEGAWRFAFQATQILPNIANVLLLARAAKGMGKLDDALNCYETILKDFPTNPFALMELAEVYEEAGYRGRAIACYEKVQEAYPDQIQSLSRLAKLYSYADAQRLFALYERMQPSEASSIDQKIVFQSQFVARKEYAERASRNMPSQAAALDDLSFRFAKDELQQLENMCDVALAGAPDSRNALSCKAMCMVARGALKEAEPIFQARAAAEPGSLYETVFFNETFYQTLEVVDEPTLVANLPPLIDVVQADFDEGPIIFLSCDTRYFVQFTRPLLLSIDDVAPKAQVHVHIMHASNDDLEAARLFCASMNNIKIGVSGEYPAPGTQDRKSARNYFHAVRFVRMLQFLSRYQKPLWLMDVDALLNRDPQPILKSLNGVDVVLYGHAGRLEPWFQFNASVVGVYPTPSGRKYLRMVAAYINHFHSRNQLRWGIDQLAMYGVFRFLENGANGPVFKMLPPKVLAGDYDPEGAIWGNGTAAKFSDIKPLAALASEPQDSPRIRYFQALNKYTARLT